jgi:hypothetical protein
MSATVRPEKLREALNAKLGTAGISVHELQQAEAPELNRHWDPRAIVITFLHAARGVYPTAETFGKSQPGVSFEAWYQGWLSGLGTAEQALWRLLRDERVAQEHGDGAGLTSVFIPIMRGVGMLEIRNNSSPLGIPPAQGSKGGVRFAAHPSRPASEVCEEILQLCKRFVADFTRDHAHLIP